MKAILRSRTGRQGAGAGSVYITLAFALAGALTYVFQSLSAHALGKTEYGPLALLWSATFLTVQILWTGGTQTLGRYVAEREAQGQGWQPVIRSVRRWQRGLLVVFVAGALAASPLLTRLFGDPWLTVAFIVAVVAYAPEYFRRGIFNGYRQSSRLGAQIVAEASGRVLVAAALLAAGAGVIGPAAAIVVAPVIGLLLVRSGPVEAPEREGEPFSAGRAFGFAAPVLTCMACAQIFATSGPILVSVLGGTHAQAGLFGAAIILTRIPQYVLSPAIGALLPHASRILVTEGREAFNRFLGKTIGILLLVGALMVLGAWLLGEWGITVFAGPDFDASRSLLVALAALAAVYLLCDLLNQMLFARGLGRLSACAWLLGLPVSLLCLVVLPAGLLDRVAYSLVAGICSAAVAQVALYLTAQRRPAAATGPPGP